jgi:hypothetical protein
VYEALDHNVKQVVALKLLVPPPAAAERARARLRREVAVVRGLNHENLVRVFDLVEEGPWSFVIMERVQGSDLGRCVERHGPLDVDAVVKIGVGLCAALGVAHAASVLHRDIKPQNVLCESDYRPRLTDFGSARVDGQETLTQTGALVGTLGYSAPEVLAGERGDARSDLYALGMTLYFALTGRLPGKGGPGRPPEARPEGHAPGADRPGRDVPPWLDAVIARATSSEPRRRFLTAREFGDALSRRTAPVVLTRSNLDFCLVCGTQDPLGGTVCSACRGASERTDALIMVDEGAMPARAVALRKLIAGQSTEPWDDVLAGVRPLLRVPKHRAADVLDQLSRRGVVAHALPGTHSLELLPRSLLALTATAFATGLAAGFVAAPPLIALSPIVALAMVAYSLHERTVPYLTPAPRPPIALPKAVGERVRSTFTALPAGSARSMLAELVAVVRTPLEQADPGDAGRLVEVVTSACDAARELAQIDETLARLGAMSAHQSTLPAEWEHGAATCERARDGLIQRMLEVTAVVAQVQGDAVVAERDRLKKLASELAEEIKVRKAAQAEVAALLSGPAP